MSHPFEGLVYVQNFFQLNFLFSGLEVSPTAIFVSRVLVFLVVSVGVTWALVRISLRMLDCLQELFARMGSLPGSLFLVLLLIVPLSPDSAAGRWIGWFLVVFCIVAVTAMLVLAGFVWKYGIDKALGLVESLRSRTTETGPRPSPSPVPADKVTTAVMESPERIRPDEAPTWPAPV